jgi:hypothetical protein
MKVQLLNHSDVIGVRGKLASYRNELYNILTYTENATISAMMKETKTYYSYKWGLFKVPMTEEQAKDFFKETNYYDLSRVWGIRSGKAYELFTENNSCQDYIIFVEFLIEKLECFISTNKNAIITFDDMDICNISNIEKLIKKYSEAVK